MAKQLTKKDVKDVLEPFARATQKEFRRIDVHFMEMNSRLENVEKDVAWMKKNSSELFATLKTN